MGKAVLIKGEVPPSNQYGPRPRPLHLIETGKTADTGKDLQYAHNTITPPPLRDKLGVGQTTSSLQFYIQLYTEKGKGKINK